MESDVQVQNVFSLVESIGDVLPGEAQRLRHGGINFGAGLLGGDQLVGLPEELLHGGLLALEPNTKGGQLHSACNRSQFLTLVVQPLVAKQLLMRGRGT